MNLDPKAIRQQIENLKIANLSLMEDAEDWLLSIESETDATELLTKIVRNIEDAKALILGTKDRLEELKERKDRFERRIDSLRNLALSIMDAAYLKKIELPEATLSIRNGSPQIIGDPDVNDIPDEFCKIKKEPNRSVIKDVLLSGGVVHGFTLSNGTPSISIRIK